MIRSTLIMLILVSTACQAALAGGKARAVREAAEFLMKRFGKEVAEESVETLAAKISKYSAKYGDDAIEAIRKVGPRGFKLLDDAGENAPHVARLLKRYGGDAVRIVSKPRSLALVAKYGDEAAEAMIDHPGIAAPLIETLGQPAVAALRNVSPQNARRITMMMDDGTLTKAGRADELLQVIGKYGDRAADFVWKHKGAIAVSAVAASFLADPEPYIDGTRDLAEVAVQPFDSAAKEVGRGVGEGTQWTVVIVGVAICFVALVALRQAMPRIRSSKRRTSRRRKTTPRSPRAKHPQSSEKP